MKKLTLAYILFPLSGIIVSYLDEFTFLDFSYFTFAFIIFHIGAVLMILTLSLLSEVYHFINEIMVILVIFCYIAYWIPVLYLVNQLILRLSPHPTTICSICNSIIKAEHGIAIIDTNKWTHIKCQS